MKRLPSLSCTTPASRCSYIYFNETGVSVHHCATGTLLQLLKLFLSGIIPLSHSTWKPPKLRNVHPILSYYFSNGENLSRHWTWQQVTPPLHFSAFYSHVPGDNRGFYCYFRCRNLLKFQPSCLPWDKARGKYVTKIPECNRGVFNLLKCALAELLLPTVA